MIRYYYADSLSSYFQCIKEIQENVMKENGKSLGRKEQIQRKSAFALVQRIIAFFPFSDTEPFQNKCQG